MADTPTYKSTLTGPELDEALRNIGKIQDNIEKAAGYAETAEQYGTIVEQNQTAIQVIQDNLPAVQGAAANAQSAAANAKAAAQSAQEAQTAAQQALGFRTFFSAVSPDENGDLDPSRPMNTPTAQESWTIKSKGDRIQSVQIDGFTTQSGTGDPSPTNVRAISTAGKKFVKIMFDGSSDENWSLSSGSGDGPTGSKRFSIAAEIAASNTSYTQAPKGYCTRLTGNTPNNTYSGYSGENAYSVIQESGKPYIQVRIAHVSTLEDLRRDLAANPITVWYEPADESQATGLYIPIQSQGHEYRCQCLKLTEPLCNGDKVESNVPSGCDKRIVLDGTESFALAESPGNVFQNYNLLANSENFTAICNDYTPGGNSWAAMPDKSVLNSSNILGFRDSECKTAGGFKAMLAARYAAGNPVVVWYRSTAYTEANDIPVALETHNFGVYTVTGQENITATWSDVSNPNLYCYTFKVPFSMVNRSPNLKCNQFDTSTTMNQNALSANKVLCSATGLYFCFDGVSTVSDAKAFFAAQYSAGTPVTVVVPLSTPIVYAHDPVTLVAVPYTEADATAAQQLANTPSTLPYIDSADIPMLLDETAQPMTLAAPLASTPPVAGTYVVSSQDGTTVQVSLKAMQDGGDAATVGGASLEQIKAAFPIIQSGTVQTTTIGPLQDLPIDITFTTPMPDTNYAVSFGVYLGAGYWSALRCRCTSKRTDGFGLDVRNDASDGSADPASIDWIAVHQ